MEAAEGGEGDGPESEFVITQGVEMERPCKLFIGVILKEGRNAVESITLSGSAVVVLEGETNVD